MEKLSKGLQKKVDFFKVLWELVLDKKSPKLSKGLQKKVKFFRVLNALLQLDCNDTTMEKVEYKIIKDKWGGIEEYLVVTYRGGAIAPRRCTGSSVGVGIEEFGKLVFGGYYNEVEDYKNLLNNCEEVLA